MHLSGVAFALFSLALQAQACSRVAFNSGPAVQDRIVVGRSMDWFVATNASIWSFPPGIERNGNAGSNSLTWTSKYGSVITAMYYVATVDGINTEGLSGNFLYLSDSNYGNRDPSRPGLSVGGWLQYFLDNYATVDEAFKDLYDEDGEVKFQVATAEIIPGTPSVGHISLTDPSGDNLIMEYLDGVLTIHRGKEYPVMTNSPPFEQQLAVEKYWLPIGNQSLPGTRRAADRFARLSYYNNVTALAETAEESIAIAASMIRAVSVPFSPSVPGEPNVASTLWRTYADTVALRYYWESALAPMFLWIDLPSIDLAAGAPSKMLELQNVDATTRVGNMDNSFVDTPAFPFLEVE
ncbi:hypothetical protein PV10_08349 [Exophiala mesophila]|uniref:Choloylglycine hydrolase/NAAA C-terminal domain-containing protein n=1 Tax=Exophiala mesophila TaxID=212818 RepID=A0A0D1XKG1_EXOME|nr:uncharacterized protein PV10_08349 [Exophiala mesophila]KIV88691.1 hypothetical protein PV10_08349 [Exophiala mesophila]